MAPWQSVFKQMTIYSFNEETERPTTTGSHGFLFNEKA